MTARRYVPRARRASGRARRRRLLAGSSLAGFAAALAVGAAGGGALHNRVSATPTTSGPSTTPTTGSPSGTRTATGPAENYGYGTMSVAVTVRGRQIVGVSIASLATAESYSQMLAQQTIPMLKNEVLSAQSSQVSTVSGATYTSEAYLMSLQAALNSLGV